MCEGETFNFEREKIIEHCEGIEELTEQIKYLRCVLKEYKTNPPDLDENYGIRPTLVDFLQEHIEYRKYLLDLPESNEAGLVKIRGKNINIDIVRIFEAMMDTGMISKKTEIKQVLRIFFSEAIDIERNVASYNARKGEVDKGRQATSKELKDFIKYLIEKNYKGREKSIFELQEFLAKLH